VDNWKNMRAACTGSQGIHWHGTLRGARFSGARVR
jgi:hypothetical protein